MERLALARALGGTADSIPLAGLACVVREKEPIVFQRQFAAAVAAGGNVFLANPDWGASEIRQVEALLARPDGRPTAAPELGWLMIPTGGSSGHLKFARHDQVTIAAAVQGFVRTFGFKQVNAVGLLPLHHVSGLIAWMRCALSGGRYLPADWKSVEAGHWPELPAAPEGWVLSLVPTQLERLLRAPAAVEWLRTFRCIFVGGGPTWPALLEAAALARLPLSTGYGMTETAAMVAALRPLEFLAGARNSGRAMWHARITLGDEDVIRIASDSVFRGYYPDWSEARCFTTEDLGWIDVLGRLQVLGRRDGVIITGGEKVQPTEVEAVLRATGQFDDVAVIGVADREWGQQVVAAYPEGVMPDLVVVRATVERQLAAFKRPKRYLAVPGWPRNAQGKLNCAALREEVRSLLAKSAPEGAR